MRLKGADAVEMEEEWKVSRSHRQESRFRNSLATPPAKSRKDTGT